MNGHIDAKHVVLSLTVTTTLPSTLCKQGRSFPVCLWSQHLVADIEAGRLCSERNYHDSWTDMKVIKDCLKWIVKKIGVALGHVLDFMVKVMDRIVEDG